MILEGYTLLNEDHRAQPSEFFMGFPYITWGGLLSLILLGGLISIMLSRWVSVKGEIGVVEKSRLPKFIRTKQACGINST